MALGNEAAHHESCVVCDRPLETKVLQSGAGFYIGCFCPEDGPNNRETGYYSSRERATSDLEHWKMYGFFLNPRL
jgi:hypothetical protein